ncbi:MAG: hypothetical protein VB099_15380 [Candidatus Limiplasma sp.]|nr:hypothetical protein [Candidatus Limiplasma sp.]
MNIYRLLAGNKDRPTSALLVQKINSTIYCRMQNVILPFMKEKMERTQENTVDITILPFALEITRP